MNSFLPNSSSILSFSVFLLGFVFSFAVNLLLDTTRHTPQCPFYSYLWSRQNSPLVIHPRHRSITTREARVTLTLKSMADNWLAWWVPTPIIPCCKTVIRLITVCRGRASPGENTETWWGMETDFWTWSSLTWYKRHIQVPYSSTGELVLRDL